MQNECIIRNTEMIDYANADTRITGISIHMQTCYQLDVNTVNVLFLWSRKMKNPCHNCLVTAACTNVCQEKTNYGIILNGKIKRYREYVRDFPRDQGLNRRLNYFERISQKHMRQIGDIIRRDDGLL